MRKLLAFLALPLIAGCVPSVAPPVRAPQPRYVPPPAPTPIPTPKLSGDWRDWPLTPGDWVYRKDARGGLSMFGQRGQDAVFTIRCDAHQRRIYLSRAGNAPGSPPMTIVTTSTTRAVPTRPTGGTPPYMAAELMPTDQLLDAMGYSRGRFVVEQAGLPTLVIPAWPEIERVTEDCRR
ncbi:MAG: hypothetical protein ACTHMG_00610 [Sphingomonas sp.]